MKNLKRILLTIGVQHLGLLLCLHILLGASTLWGQSALRVPEDYATIQGAIDAALDGDSVLVSPGYYEENIDFSGKAIELIGIGGARRTTIDGAVGQDFGVPVIAFWTGEGPDSVLRGFSVRGISVSGTDVRGAAISAVEPCTLLRAAPTIQDCIIRNNFGGHGGGIAGNALVERCIFFCNRTSGDGGAGGRGSLTFLDCSFIRNLGLTGGAIFVDGVLGNDLETAVVSGCLFLENVAFDSARGGGILVEKVGHTLSVDQSVFFHNATVLLPPQGEQHGGAIFSCGPVLLDRSTIVGNWEYPGSFSGNYFGGVIGDITATNTILWLNRGTQFAGTQADWCDIQDGYSGQGIIDADPLFRNMAHLDFSLMPTSPCIDTGDPAGTLDPDGTRADMGAIPFDQRQSGNALDSDDAASASVAAAPYPGIRLPRPFEPEMNTLLEDLFREDARDGGGFLGGPRLAVEAQAESMSVELLGIPGAAVILTSAQAPMGLALSRQQLLGESGGVDVSIKPVRSATRIPQAPPQAPPQALPQASAVIQIVAATVLDSQGRAQLNIALPRTLAGTGDTVLEAWSLSPRYGTWGSSNFVPLPAQ